MNKIINHILKFIEENNRQVFIRICGHGAAGKTTFAENLCERLKPEAYNYLNTDPYIIGEHRKHTTAQYKLNGKNSIFTVTACMPAAHELNSLTRDILMLKNNMDFMTINMDWMPTKIIYSNRLINIVDGMTPTFLDKELFDLSIYIYTDSNTELSRRLDRDVNSRGKNKSALLNSHSHRRRQYDLYMHPHSLDFDIIINDSNNDFKIEKLSN